MNCIVASILTLSQHLETLSLDPSAYRPKFCPHCGYGKLWHHGCYERKADRESFGPKSLNPVPIPRYRCLGCGRTCSRLPECIAPRRWFPWLIQQAVLGLWLLGFSVRKSAHQYGISRKTVRRWRQWLLDRHIDFAFHLRVRFPAWGRHADFAGFWCNALHGLSLSRLMFWLDQEGVSVP